MVVRRHIERTLLDLEKKYQAALLSASASDPIYCCKLATLEYCGWIEEALDLIVKRAMRDKLRTNDFKKMFENIVKKNYGFQYAENFLPMFHRSVGLQKAELVQRSLDRSGELTVLVSELEALKVYRNTAAHTWVRNGTQNFPAPASLRARLRVVCPILRKIYSTVAQF